MAPVENLNVITFVLKEVQKNWTKKLLHSWTHTKQPPWDVCKKAIFSTPFQGAYIERKVPFQEEKSNSSLHRSKRTSLQGFPWITNLAENSTRSDLIGSVRGRNFPILPDHGTNQIAGFAEFHRLVQWEKMFCTWLFYLLEMLKLVTELQFLYTIRLPVLLQTPADPSCWKKQLS